MARIAGVDIPREKRVIISLTYIHGIGPHVARPRGRQRGAGTRVRDLTDDEVNRLREVVDRQYKVEGDLRREVSLNVKRLMEIGSYRGSPPSAQPARPRAANEDERAAAPWVEEDGRHPPQEVIEGVS